MIVTEKSRMSAIDAWQLEFVRLIAFPITPPFFIEQNWWQELVTKSSEQPTESESKVKEHCRQDCGIFQGIMLSLSVDLGRVVWEARSPDGIDSEGNYPTIGSFQEKTDWFVALLDSWLNTSCPPLVRLAFSARLLQPAASAKEAYRVLGAHLPTVKLDSTPNDFLLQINRRKKSSEVVQGLPINRVCTWSKLNPAIRRKAGRPFEWPDRCYSALELDINTAPENAEVLPRAILADLFKELAMLGTDIAEHGDTL